MRLIKQGEKANVGTKVDGSIVTVQHVTLNKPTKAKYEMSWKFDFSNVSQTDLLRLAARGLVIDQRPKFKAEKDARKLQSWDNRSFSVTEILKKERARITKAEKAAKAVEALDTNEQLELLKKLLAAKGVELPQ